MAEEQLRGTQPRGDQFLDLGDHLGGFALIDPIIVPAGLAAAFFEQRTAGGEMIHDRREDRRLQVRPIVMAVLADRQEVGPEEHPGHALDVEQVARQG